MAALRCLSAIVTFRCLSVSTLEGLSWEQLSRCFPNSRTTKTVAVRVHLKFRHFCHLQRRNNPEEVEAGNGGAQVAEKIEEESNFLSETHTTLIYESNSCSNNDNDISGKEQVNIEMKEEEGKHAHTQYKVIIHW